MENTPEQPPAESSANPPAKPWEQKARLAQLLDIESSWKYILLALAVYAVSTGMHLAALQVEHGHDAPHKTDWTECVLESVAHLARDLAIAIVVGVYLSGTLEKRRADEIGEEFQTQRELFEDRALKQEKNFAEQSKKLGENLLEVVYQSRHNRELFDAVKDSIFTQPFFRSECRNVLKLYDLKETRAYGLKAFQDKLASFAKRSREENETHVVVWFQSRYRVHNTAATPQSYKVQYYMDRFSIRDGECTDCISQVRVDGNSLLPSPIFGGETNTANAAKNESVIGFQRDVTINAGDWISVDIEAYTVRPSEWMETWGWLSPSNELEIVIEDPDGNKEIFVDITAHLPEGIPSQMQKKPGEPTLVYSVPTFLLPYNYFTVRWLPERKKAQPPSPQRSSSKAETPAAS